MNLASCSSTRWAFGPGSSVTNSGSFHSDLDRELTEDFVLDSGAVIMSSSLKKSGQRLGGACRRATNSAVKQNYRIFTTRRGLLINAVKIGTSFSGRKIAGKELEIIGHLRFQRTLPSRESSRIIPRLSSSLRMRSAVAKSRV